jgi:hypothetical protein
LQLNTGKITPLQIFRDNLPLAVADGVSKLHNGRQLFGRQEPLSP